jgi:serine/threonine protein kinase
VRATVCANLEARTPMLEPTRLQDYKLFGALGAGATSKVIEAVHLATGRRVAIKVLASPEEEVADELRERFAREAVVLSGVNSRHVGRILGFGFERGVPFLVLEHMVGETIDIRLKREGPFAMQAFTPFVSQILMGLRDCHAINVIHRDIKPANVFLHQNASGSTSELIAKIIDFGLARVQFSSGSLTSTTHVLGSVGYMAPEQFYDAKSVGPPADIYAIGCLIFRCLSGRLPFMSKSLDAVVEQKCSQDPPPLSVMDGCPDIPALDAFLIRAMDRDLGRRYRSAKEMLDHWWQLVPILEAIPATTRARSDSIPILVEDMVFVEDADIDSGWGEPDESTAGLNSPRFETLHGPPRPVALGQAPKISRKDSSGPSSTTSVDAWQEIPTVRHDKRLRDLINKELELAKKK